MSHPIIQQCLQMKHYNSQKVWSAHSSHTNYLKFPTLNDLSLPTVHLSMMATVGVVVRLMLVAVVVLTPHCMTLLRCTLTLR